MARDQRSARRASISLRPAHRSERRLSAPRSGAGLH
jgi:hypothetical protein